ncbi:MAG TPA: hypothetical protein VHQ43_08610 [Solirubrobacterales bacterium]|jgi:hypothetical protein|nr:hypothetical protein [Solirubrobacterales bacterium]
MARARLAISLIAIAACAASLTLPAQAARVQVGNLVLRADGGFTPRLLPKGAYAPIDFEGHADIGTTDGSMPPALRRIALELDSDGKLDPRGIAACPPERIQGTSPSEARRRCAGAIVGRGHAAAAIALPGTPRVSVRSPLTLFNGPPQGGQATIVVHAQTTYPVVETFVLVVPVERRAGLYGYRTNFEVPPIAGGFGSLTHVDVRIGRHFRSGGRERSFISARCSDYILQTRGTLLFSDGNVISGSLFKPCLPLP